MRIAEEILGRGDSRAQGGELMSMFELAMMGKLRYTRLRMRFLRIRLRRIAEHGMGSFEK